MHEILHHNQMLLPVAAAAACLWDACAPQLPQLMQLYLH